MRNIVIFGASGHGSVILDAIESAGIYQVVGFIDSYKEVGSKRNGYEVIGRKEDLPTLIEKFNILGGIVAVGDNWLRRNLVHRILQIIPNFNFVTVIHPTVVLGKDVSIGKGTVIMARAVVNSNSRIHQHCIINTGSILEHDGELADYSSLAPRVSTGGHFRLGYCSAVSLGANVIENITIDQHTVVGAGSLVMDDLPSRVLAYGSPARVVRRRNIGEPYLCRSKFRSHTYSVGKS